MVSWCFASLDPLIDDLKGVLGGYRETNLKNRGGGSKSSRFAIHQKPDMIKPSINSQKSQHRKVKNEHHKPKVRRRCLWVGYPYSRAFEEQQNGRSRF